MTALLTALGSGISAKKILEFLMKKSPDLKNRISQALATGLSAEKIVQFFSKDKNFEKLRSSMEEEYPMENNSNPLVQGQNIRNKNLGSDMASGLQRNIGPILGTTGALGASYVLSRAIPQILQQTKTEPEIPINQTMTTENQLQMPLNQQTSQPPVNLSNLPQQQTQLQPEIKNIDSEQLLTKLNLKNHIDKLKNRYKNPAHIAAILYNRFPKEMRAMQKESGKPMEEAIGDYLSTKSQSVNPSLTTEQEETAPIEKNAIVASPNGIGEVKEIRNGQALIDIDGKLHKAKEEDLIQSPISEKDLADLYNDLVGGIEKESGQEVSRNVYWSGYDPRTNELAYVPHDGALYIYDNISPEDAKELTSLLTQRKSTGQNYIGAWSKGTQSTIGAAMYKLIQKLQNERGGKGNEYSGKFEKLYDALELAKNAAKKKYEEKRKAKKPRPN